MASMPRTPLFSGQPRSTPRRPHHPHGHHHHARPHGHRRRLHSEHSGTARLPVASGHETTHSVSGPLRQSRLRLFSGSEIMDTLERFNRRTISTSSHQSQFPHDVQQEVESILGGMDPSHLEDDVIEEEETAPGEGDGEEGLLPPPQDASRNSLTAITNFETIIHLLKGNLGIGILTLPMAIRNSGLILGSFGLVVIAVICIYCMRMLVHSANKAVRRRPHLTFLDYADTAECCFIDAGGAWSRWAKFMSKLVNTFLILTQVGSNAVYALFIAQNIQPIFVQNAPDTFADLNYRYYILMVLPFMILMCSIRNLRYLSPFSVLANIIQFLGLAIIFYYLFREPLPRSDTVPWVASSDRLPLFFGTAIFAIEGICVVLPIENQMRRPQDMLRWNGVLNTAMSWIVCLYIAVGFYGYLVYGDDVQSTITLNLPSDDVLAQVTQALFSLAIFFSYALQFYVLMEIIGPNLLQPMLPNASPKVYSCTDFFVRGLLNVITFALAATVPWLDLLVSLLGAVKMSTLAIMAPALIDSACLVSEGTTTFQNRFCLARNCLIFAFGLFGMVMGTYVSMVNIVENFKYGAE